VALLKVLTNKKSCLGRKLNRRGKTYSQKFGNQCLESGALRGGNTAVIRLYVATDCEGTSVIWVGFISHLDRLCDLPVVAVFTGQ